MPLADQAVLARTHDQLAVVRRALDRVGVACRFAPAPDAEAGPATSRGRPVVSTAGPGEAETGVELVTFHRAKGLEWQAVHVVGLESGLVPIVHAATPEALAEERRLLYVALTRAGRVLECSWARSRAMGSGPGHGAPAVALARADLRRGVPSRARPGRRAPGCRAAVRRPAGQPEGLTRTGPADGQPAGGQSSEVSMNTGVWSDGFSPLRA